MRGGLVLSPLYRQTEGWRYEGVHRGSSGPRLQPRWSSCTSAASVTKLSASQAAAKDNRLSASDEVGQWLRGLCGVCTLGGDYPTPRSGFLYLLRKALTLGLGPRRRAACRGRAGKEEGGGGGSEKAD